MNSAVIDRVKQSYYRPRVFNKGCRKKKSFLSGLATTRGTGGKGRATKKQSFLRHLTKEYVFCIIQVLKSIFCFCPISFSWKYSKLFLFKLILFESILGRYRRFDAHHQIENSCYLCLLGPRNVMVWSRDKARIT